MEPQLTAAAAKKKGKGGGVNSNPTQEEIDKAFRDAAAMWRAKENERRRAKGLPPI